VKKLWRRFARWFIDKYTLDFTVPPMDYPPYDYDGESIELARMEEARGSNEVPEDREETVVDAQEGDRILGSF
jgi:hypothetical protein